MAENPKTCDSKEFTLQGGGGVPAQTQGFTVQEYEQTNQPDDGGSWNPKTDNPVGPK